MKFVRLSDEDRLVELVVNMAEKLKSRNANFQVLSPKYEGIVGVNHLNEMLRDRLNPKGPKEWIEGESHFRLGDRLMVTQNDYKLGVYNGDMGKLTGIHGDRLIVKIHGVSPDDPDMLVDFPFESADKLRLAYAISVHKSQGSEFDTVILPVTRSQGRMLQRNLIYTAVTRARKQVWLLGEEDAIRKAIGNNLVIRRNTALAAAIGVEIAHGGRPASEVEEAAREAASGHPVDAGDRIIFS
jgi:exodeoxyribonuclease V alpha subunit